MNERLRQIRKKLNLTQKQLSDKIGISLRALQNYESNLRKIPSELVKKISEQLSVNPNWLLTGEGEMFIDDVEKKMTKVKETFSYIPLYDVKAAAGAGFVNDKENIADFLAFKTNWIKNILHTSPKNLFLIHVIGDSMEPTLEEGDIILGDKSKADIKKDGIYVIRRDEQLLIKRIQFQGDNIEIKSDNKFYSPYSANLKSIEIIGKAVWYGRKM